MGLETAPIKPLGLHVRDGLLAKGHPVTPEWLLLQLVGRTQRGGMVCGTGPSGRKPTPSPELRECGTDRGHEHSRMLYLWGSRVAAAIKVCT